MLKHYSTRRLLLSVLLLSAGVPNVRADLPYEQEPINYSKTAPNDPVARLQKALDAGSIKLDYDEHFGYLPAVLKQLNVPVSSQSLVFSKTSFQRSRISPRTPRGVYFNDDVYVGFVQNGEVMELSAVDSRLGANFYSLAQEKTDTPQFVRHTDNCLVCHSSSRTSEVPGHLVRSMFIDRSGQPVFSAGTYTTNHESPFSERWGGWYVTGKHGRMSHMGNALVVNTERPEKIDRAEVANTIDLSKRFNPSAYLSRHSDIVALMVLEHQTHMQNLITRASFEGRIALHYNDTMNKAFKESAENRLESVTRRLNNAAESLLKYLLFIDETRLEDPVIGTADFAREFAGVGPRDRQGRSLRDFDLQTRLFKYPCSYLIYSDAFDKLPADVKTHFYRRLSEILTEQDQTPAFAKLTTADRMAIYEILRDTKQDLPEYWK